MKVTKITDVAKEAGVSPATVSYVLSGNRPISEQTRQKVLNVVHELGYVPNANAQALKAYKSWTIGLLASDFSEISVSQIILNVEQIACKNNYHIFFASGIEFDYNVRDALAFLNRRKLDGIIVLFGITSNIPVGEIEGLDIPVVSINRPINTISPCILPDNRDGGYRAALHLIDSGCRHLSLITGLADRFSSAERIRGFRDGLREKGIQFTDKNIYYGDFSYESGKRGLEKLLQKDENIDALFCANDEMAAGAINSAIKKGIRIPEDIKIMGCDNSHISAVWPIPITTLNSPFEEMGKRSATILLSMIEGEPIEISEVYVKSSLIRRRSTGY